MTQVVPTPSVVSSYKFDVVAYICRVQIFHKEHERTIRRALEIGEKVVVIIGSAGKARDTRNPFTFEERKATIAEVFGNDPRLHFEAQRDYPYNDTMWSSYIQMLVKKQAKGIKDPRIGLIGHRKDDTGYYIDMFPQWEFIEVGETASYCASDLRKILFNPAYGPAQRQTELAKYVSPISLKHILQFAYDKHELCMPSQEMERLMREATFLRKHAESWAGAPYKPTFVTVDAVVIQSGHVLLIKRRSAPGEGLWAIPGGYLDAGERINDAWVRELHEETKLKVSINTLKGSVVDQQVFDYPGRSLRGRIITHAYCVKLRDGVLPKIKAASDAKKAEWVPLSEFYQMQDQMFEDHFSIIDHFVSKLKDQ